MKLYLKQAADELIVQLLGSGYELPSCVSQLLELQQTGDRENVPRSMKYEDLFATAAYCMFACITSITLLNSCSDRALLGHDPQFDQVLVFRFESTIRMQELFDFCIACLMRGYDQQHERVQSGGTKRPREENEENARNRNKRLRIDVENNDLTSYFFVEDTFTAVKQEHSQDEVKQIKGAASTVSALFECVMPGLEFPMCVAILRALPLSAEFDEPRIRLLKIVLHQLSTSMAVTRYLLLPLFL